MFGSPFRSRVQTPIDEGDAARRLGMFHQAEGRYKEAYELAEEDGALSDAEYGMQHIPLGEILVKLGRLYEAMGRLDDSDQCYRSALKIFSSVVGDEYFDLAVARDRMAVYETVPVGAY